MKKYPKLYRFSLWLVVVLVGLQSCNFAWAARQSRPTSKEQTAQKSVNDVLGWRPKEQDSKEFADALNQPFETKEAEKSSQRPQGHRPE